MRGISALFCVFYCQAVDVKHADGSLKATSEVRKQTVDDVKNATSTQDAESVEELRRQLEEANKKIARLEATEELRAQLEAAHAKIALLEQQVETLSAGQPPMQASVQVQANGGYQPVVRGGPGGAVSPVPGQMPARGLTEGGQGSLPPRYQQPSTDPMQPTQPMASLPPPGQGGLQGQGAGPAQGKTITFCAKSLGPTPINPKLPGGTVTIPTLTLGGQPIPVGTPFSFAPPDDQCKSKFEYENVATACLQIGPGCASDPAFAQDQSFLPCTFDTTINEAWLQQINRPRGTAFQVTLTQIFPGAKTAEWAPGGTVGGRCPGGCFLYYDDQNKGVGACVVGGPGQPGASAVASLLAFAFFLLQ